MSGAISYHKGLAAEETVARAYRKSGFHVLEQRWKTKDGEIDLIACHQEKLYFVEVKSSRSHESAAQRVTEIQQGRIQRAALRYIEEKIGHLDVDCRFDVALVDKTGKAKVLPGAFGTN